MLRGHFLNILTEKKFFATKIVRFRPLKTDYLSLGVPEVTTDPTTQLPPFSHKYPQTSVPILEKSFFLGHPNVTQCSLWLIKYQMPMVCTIFTSDFAVLTIMGSFENGFFTLISIIHDQKKFFHSFAGSNVDDRSESCMCTSFFY